jgi:hypothetical protein
MLRKTVIPIPPATEDERPRGVRGESKTPLGRFDLHVRPDGKFGEGSLEGALSHPRCQSEHALLVRRSHHGDVPPKSLVVLVANIRKRDEEVLPRREVDLFVEQVERH